MAKRQRRQKWYELENGRIIESNPITDMMFHGSDGKSGVKKAFYADARYDFKAGSMPRQSYTSDGKVVTFLNYEELQYNRSRGKWQKQTVRGREGENTVNEFFSSDLPDLSRLREALMSADENVRAAAIRGVEKGGRRILAAQRAYAPENLRDRITMETETLRDGTVRAKCGYQKAQFSSGPPGWSFGLQGAVAEYGSPGHSSAERASQYYEVVVGGKKRKKKKRGRVAQPHIRRGYDEQFEAAVQDALGELDRAADIYR